MRPVGFFLLLLALIGGEGVLAQVPDTLDPRGYFPLSVGNVWEYEHALRRPAHPERPHDESAIYRERYQILDSSTVGDTTFFALLLDVRDEEDALILRDTSRIWYDAEEASIQGERLPAIIEALRCLDAPFESTGSASPCWSFVERSAVQLPDLFGAEASVQAKVFSSLTSNYVAVVHGLGVVGSGGGCHPCGPLDDYESWALKYARIDGQEYGVRIVQTERPEPFPTAALAVYPNPTRGAITAKLPGAGRLDVFDLLGRRMHTADVKRPGKITLNLASYAPGLYVLRFEGEVRTIIVQ